MKVYFNYNRKDIERLMRRNGYSVARRSGSHFIYTNVTGHHITIPDSLNPMVIHRLIKENNLI